MPTYSIKGIDGKTYSIQGPEGLSEAQVVSAIQSELRDQEESVLQRNLDEKRDATINALYDQQDEEDAGFLENIAKGFGAGVVDVGETASLGIAALLEEESERSVRDKIKAAAGAVRPEGGDEDSILYNLSRALGSVAGIAVPATAAAVAAPASLATAAATGVAGLLGVSAAAGEGSERARAAGATEAERSAATLKAAPIGILEILPITRFVKAVDVPVVSKILEKIGPEKVETIGERVNNALTTGGLEGAQEATANVLQNLVESGYNEEVSLLAGTAENAGYGAGAGAITQLFVDALRGRRGRAATTEPTTEEPDTQGELFVGEDLGIAPAEQTIRNNPSILDLTNTEFDEYNPGLPEGRDYKDLGIPDEDTYFEIAKIRNQPTAQRELFVGDLGRAPERAGDPDQPDLFAPRAPQSEAVQPDMIEEAESAQLREIIDADETAQIQAMLDEDVRAQETRAASDVETIAGQLDTQRQQTTEQRRTAVLQDVIENTPTKQESTLTKNFSNALKAEGITNTQPNESETRTIKRAIDVQRAERPVPVEEPETKPKQFQVRDGQRLPRTEVPFVPERLSATETRSVTKKDMDDLNIKPAAPIRKRIEGKDVTTPEVQKELKAYANLPAAPAEAKEKINEQLNLFGSTESIQQGEQTPIRPTDDTRTDRVSFTPARQPRVGSADTTRTDAPARQRLGDTGANLTDTARRTAGRTTPLKPITPTTIPTVAPVAERVTPKAAPKKRRPIDQIMEAARARGMTVTPAQARELQTKDLTDEQLEAQVFEERDTQEATQLQEDLESVTIKKKPAAKKAAPKRTTPEEKEKVKKEIATRVKTQVEAAVSPKAREEASNVKFYSGKFADAPKTSFTNEKGEQETISLDVNTSQADDTKILELINTKIPEQQSKKKEVESGRETARAAQTYFGRQEDPNNALEVIAHEMVFARDVFRSTKDMSQGEKQYFAGTGSKKAALARQWVSENLSAETNAAVDRIIASHNRALMESVNTENSSISVYDTVATQRKIDAKNNLTEALEAQQDLIEQKASFKNAEAQATLDDLNDFLPDYLRENSVVGLDIPTHPVIGNLLRQGKLVEALRALQTTSPSGRVAQLAGALSKVVGDTKVEVKQSVVDDAGNAVAGKFDPTTNTITLNAETGINPHTILHEMTHAATSATLANKSHPLTKQLTKLFNDVKDSLDTAYGSQNVDEFVAETFSNPEFQRKLAGITPEGKPISALQRFFNSVANVLRRIMGMQTKNVGSALNQADQLIEATLAPAPNNRFAGELYLINNIMSMIKTQQTPVGYNKVTFIEKVKDFIDGRAADNSKKFLLFSLPLQAVVDFARGYKLNVAATKLQKVIEEQIGSTNKADERVDGTLKSIEAWVKNNPTLKEALDRVVYLSTIEHVDPSKPESDYKKDPEKLKAHKKMRADWNALSAKGGDKIYAEMRDAYKKTFNDLKAVIGKQIDDTIADPAERKKLRESVYEKMFDRNSVEPYFPLTRKGDLWIRYDAFNERTQTTEPVYEAFETYGRRKARIAELNGDPRLRSKPKEYSDIKSITFGDAPSGSFMRDALDILKANQPQNPTKEEAARYEEQKEQLMRLFIQALPETSFAKSLQKRENYEGYIVDSIDAFRDKAYSLSRQVERLRYSNEIRIVEDELRAAWKASKKDASVDSEKAQLVLDELLERASFARNPPSDTKNQLAAQANRFAFLGTIGFNVSSAIVNLSQVPLIMIPLLTGRYRSSLGINAPTAALGRAMATITGSGFSRKLAKMDGTEIDAGGMPSIDNYYETLESGELVVRSNLNIPVKKRKILERYKPIVKMAEARGLLNRSLFYDTLSIDKAGRNRTTWETANAYSAFVFHTAERLNRQVALLASFDLELAKMEKSGATIDAAALENAASTAVYLTTEMNGGAALATAPRIAQQGVGRVAMMYKSYGIQMYYTLFKTADRALRRMENNKYPPEVVKAARDQFVGVALSSGLLAGVQGMPLVGGMIALANLLLYDDDELDAETVLRQHIGEMAYKGPLNALTGTDVASRIGLSNLLYRPNPYNQGGSPADRAMELIGGPAWSVFSQFNRGIREITSPDGNFERGVEAMLPAAFRNAYKGIVRYPRDEGILTRRGDVIHDDITTGGAIAQVLGFAPTEYTLKQEQNQQIKRIERNVNQRRTKLLREYYIAMRFGDHAGAKSVTEKIKTFNKKHPSNYISNDSVKKSMAQHARTSEKMHNGVTINPKMRGVLLDHVDNYWGSSFGFAED